MALNLTLEFIYGSFRPATLLSAYLKFFSFNFLLAELTSLVFFCLK